MPAHKRIPYIRQAFNKEVEAAAQGNESLYDRIVLIRHASSLYEDIELSYLKHRIASIRLSSSLNHNLITASFSERIESTRKAFNLATELFNIAEKDNREIGMAGLTQSFQSEMTSGQKQELPSSGPSQSRGRTVSKEEVSPEGSVGSPDSQEAPSPRDSLPAPVPSPAPAKSPSPAPKPIRSRLKTEHQAELLEICTRWIRLYVHDRNGGKTFWDKVHEVLENTGIKYSADSCKGFVTGMVHIYEQRAPVDEELEGPLRAFKLAVDGRKREEKQHKIDEEKAKKEKAEQKKVDKEKAERGRAERKKKADKEKADKEKADKEKADKEKADKEKAAKRSGSKRPVVASKKPREAPQTTVPDSQEDTEQANSTEETSIPSIELDRVARQQKRELADITPIAELPQKKPRTRSCTAHTEGRRPMSAARATSLQPVQTQRRQVAKPTAKPTATITPSSKPSEKRKRLAPKASEDDAPESSTRPAKRGKKTNDFLKEMSNRLENHLNRLETNIDGKFEDVKKELEVLKMEISSLSQWHIQLNNAINHEQGIALKDASKGEATNTSEAEAAEQSSGNEDEADGAKSTDDSKTIHDDDDESKSPDENAEPTTKGTKLATIQELTETTIIISGKSEEQAPKGDDSSKKDAPESSGDDSSSSSSDEDEEVPAGKIAR